MKSCILFQTWGGSFIKIYVNNKVYLHLCIQQVCPHSPSLSKKVGVIYSNDFIGVKRIKHAKRLH